MSTDATAPLRLLVVDDDEVDRLAICRALAAAGVVADVEQMASGRRALARALSTPLDCVLLDVGLPDLAADRFVRLLRDGRAGTPVLLVTGHGEDHLAACFEAGATDFLPKADLTPARLASRLRSTLRIAHAEEETRAALAAARHAVAVRDQMVAIVSHDLRNPLAAARLAVDQLVDPALGAEERGQLHAAMGRALGRADRLIRDLLEVSRLEAGRLTLSARPVAPAALLSAAAHDHAATAAQAGCALELSIAPGLPRIQVDPDRMLQVLDNLVANAVAHAPGAPIELGARAGERGIELWVSDHGPGIPEAELPHVFDRFYQAGQQRRAGAGLGLAIAQGIVRAHGGVLEVASDPGRGCRFAIALPPVGGVAVPALG